MSQQQNNSYSTEFLMGALAGALIGGLAAVWYAPQSGKQTREEISSWVRKNIVEKIQGESVEQSIETGRTIAHTHRAEQAKRLPAG